jgi:hypothetical protein
VSIEVWSPPAVTLDEPHGLGRGEPSTEATSTESGGRPYAVVHHDAVGWHRLWHNTEILGDITEV